MFIPYVAHYQDYFNRYQNESVCNHEQLKAILERDGKITIQAMHHCVGCVGNQI